MRLGQKVVCTPEVICEHTGGPNSHKKVMTGKIVYIRPQERYIVVEFELLGGTIRQGFFPHEVQFCK